MRVLLVTVALALITASLVAFLWGGAGDAQTRVQRSIVSGRVTGEMSDHPWIGSVVELGPERAILSEDGRFSFAVMPGPYSLKVCCSMRFAAISKDLVVGADDIKLDLPVEPLTQIQGHVVIQKSTQVPYGFLVTASRTGTNVVDRAATAIDGTFAFHLMEGLWKASLENLPEGYTLVSMTLGDEKISDGTFQLSKGAPDSLALQITLKE